MIKYTDELLAPLFYAMGTIVVCWSYIEQPIDMWVAIVYQNCGGKPIAKYQQIPRAFSTKVRFLRDCLQKLDPLIPFREEGNALIDRAELIAMDRNDIIHMRLCGTNPDGTFNFYKFDYKRKTIHEVHNLKFSINDLLKFGKKMLALSTDLTQYCGLLRQQFVPLKENPRL